jgi:hypothetical protein
LPTQEAEIIGGLAASGLAQALARTPLAGIAEQRMIMLIRA